MTRIRQAGVAGSRGRLGSITSGRTPLLTSAPAPPVLDIPDTARCALHDQYAMHDAPNSGGWHVHATAATAAQLAVAFKLLFSRGTRFCSAAERAKLIGDAAERAYGANAETPAKKRRRLREAGKPVKRVQFREGGELERVCCAVSTPQ